MKDHFKKITLAGSLNVFIYFCHVQSSFLKNDPRQLCENDARRYEPPPPPPVFVLKFVGIVYLFIFFVWLF